ncbi:hypothetical protein QR680_002405 [Steinernema hermaphroditum]|uniref:Uncharacterized protein n=1 Tax=Steinernema hermaphroditum TaxID=289476 RepID=A0AA39H4C6_9BILA|nr:hypothetical protein QR680_002405 [Steinernema hermaphroditum]
MDKHLLRTVNRAKKRIEDFQEEMPTWKVQDTQQYVERLEQTIKRMHSTSSELKIDIAGAKQEITNSNSIDDIKWNELIEEADKVLMESRDLINDLEDEVYNEMVKPETATVVSMDMAKQGKAQDSAFHPVSRLKTVEMTKDVETLQAG